MAKRLAREELEVIYPRWAILELKDMLALRGHIEALEQELVEAVARGAWVDSAFEDDPQHIDHGWSEEELEEILRSVKDHSSRGPRTSAETLLALHLDELGTVYERQYLYASPRKFRADFAIPSCRLLIEVQGGIYSKQAHGSVQGVIRDNERLNVATLAGWRILRFTPEQVEWGRAKAAIKAYLQSKTGRNLTRDS